MSAFRRSERDATSAGRRHRQWVPWASDQTECILLHGGKPLARAKCRESCLLWSSPTSREDAGRLDG
jgi:hypothetical protein